MSVRIFHTISANRQSNTSGQDPFLIQYLSVSELGNYIEKVENGSSGLDGIIMQPATETVIAILIDSLGYFFNLCFEK